MASNLPKLKDATSKSEQMSELEKQLRIDVSPTTQNGSKIAGPRAQLIMLAICLCLFLITIEITIVNTALISIANDLHSFNRSSWVITAYLLTYVGFLIIFSKLNDIIGRKPNLVFSTIWFTLWAGICGAAQNMTQLIVFRTLQGIGAAGVYSSCMILVFDLLPPEKIPAGAAGISLVSTLSLVLGPLFGGAINQTSTWRWVFIFNVPVGVIAALIFQQLIPRGFPNHEDIAKAPPHKLSLLLRSIGRRIDFFGAFYLLTASVLLVAALENASLRHPWKSPLVAVLLALSGFFWILFLGWEWWTTKQDGVREPVFPFRFLQDRATIGLLLTDFLLGPPSVAAIVSIPQRFLVVNGSSPLGAGVKLLPYTIVSSLSSMIMSAVAGKSKIPVIYIVIFGSICQTVGFGLLSYIPISTAVSHAQLGYQALAAFGCGANMTLLIVVSPLIVKKRDAAVAQGSIGQLRYMGAVIGVAILTCVLNSYVQNRLFDYLSHEQISELLQSSHMIELLPQEIRETVRLIFARGYNIQIRILMGFSAAQLVASLLMWKKTQAVLGEAAST